MRTVVKGIIETALNAPPTLRQLGLSMTPLSSNEAVFLKGHEATVHLQSMEAKVISLTSFLDRFSFQCWHPVFETPDGERSHCLLIGVFGEPGQSFGLYHLIFKNPFTGRDEMHVLRYRLVNAVPEFDAVVARYEVRR